MEAQEVVAATAVAMIFALISGEAIAKPGDPIPDIDVVIGSKPEGKVVQQIKTDAQGNFTSGVLPKGTYVLTFRPPRMNASAPAPRLPLRIPRRRVPRVLPRNVAAPPRRPLPAPSGRASSSRAPTYGSALAAAAPRR